MLHEEYINCPFVLSSPKKRRLTEPRGSTDSKGEETEKSRGGGGMGAMVLKEEDLEYFSDEEEDEQEGAGKVDRRFDLMRGINELLLQRKTKAIEERKK